MRELQAAGAKLGPSVRLSLEHLLVEIARRRAELATKESP